MRAYQSDFLHYKLQLVFFAEFRQEKDKSAPILIWDYDTLENYYSYKNYRRI